MNNNSFLSQCTPLHVLTGVMTLGSLTYATAWFRGHIDASETLTELFASINPSKDRSATPTEIVLYKNYIIGLLWTPNVTLLLALWKGTPETLWLGGLSAGVANLLYSSHLWLTPYRDIFQPKMRTTAALSHGVVGAICVASVWQASQGMD